MPRNLPAGPILTNVGPRHNQPARKGPITLFANFRTHGIRPSYLVPATCSGGVLVGNVPDQSCSHLECSRRNNLYVQTCTKGTSNPTPGGRHISPGGTTQAERSMTSTLLQIGLVWGWAVGRATQCEWCRSRAAGDVIKRRTEARRGCTQLQKEAYQIGSEQGNP